MVPNGFCLPIHLMMTSSEVIALDLPWTYPGLMFAILHRLQINKNWMVKSRVGTTSAAASVGFRAWFEPSLLVVATAQVVSGGKGWEDMRIRTTEALG